MTYAEAAKRAETWWEIFFHLNYWDGQTNPATLAEKGREAEALSVLLRAVPVMEAAERFKGNPFGCGYGKLVSAIEDYQKKGEHD